MFLAIIVVVFLLFLFDPCELSIAFFAPNVWTLYDVSCSDLQLQTADFSW